MKISATGEHLWLRGGYRMENVYRDRRQKLISLLPEDGGALVFSGEEIPLGVDMTYPFTVDKNFYYLTGLDIPTEHCLGERILYPSHNGTTKGTCAVYRVKSFLCKGCDHLIPEGNLNPERVDPLCHLTEHNGGNLLEVLGTLLLR